MLSSSQLKMAKKLLSQREGLLKELQRYPEGSHAHQIALKSLQTIDTQLDWAGGPAHQIEQTVKKTERTMEFRASLAGTLIGLIIILFSGGISWGTYHVATQEGGTYVILWGPMIFGAVVFLPSVLSLILVIRD